jgi:hypothetical protein
MRRAKLSTPTASHTENSVVPLGIIEQFVVQAVFVALTFLASYTLVAGYLGESFKMTWVPQKNAPSFGTVYVGFIRYSKAVTGWTNHVACAARTACIRKFFP